MKIIKMDNHGRENVSDVLIAENVPDYYATLIVDYLNDRNGSNGSDFFKAVPDDQKLYIFEP